MTAIEATTATNYPKRLFRRRRRRCRRGRTISSVSLVVKLAFLVTGRMCAGDTCGPTWSQRQHLSLRPPGRSLGIQRILQDHHGRGLVNRRPPGTGRDTAGPHAARGHSGGQPFVDQPHRAWCHKSRQIGSKGTHVLGSDALLTAERTRQAHDNLDDLVFSGQPSESTHIAGATPNRLERRGEQPGRITDRYPDADTADIDAKPGPRSHSHEPRVTVSPTACSTRASA